MSAAEISLSIIPVFGAFRGYEARSTSTGSARIARSAGTTQATSAEDQLGDHQRHDIGRRDAIAQAPAVTPRRIRRSRRAVPARTSSALSRATSATTSRLRPDRDAHGELAHALVHRRHGEEPGGGEGTVAQTGKHPREEGRVAHRAVEAVGVHRDMRRRPNRQKRVERVAETHRDRGASPVTRATILTRARR